ncbi:MAG: aldehyde ferredoxin oxidoreductase family protein [Candidatus Zhuqueibacterota bacterium]
MKEIYGTSNRVLEIDLTTKKITEFQITEKDRALYLGGKGLALKFLYDRMQAGIDPLSAENIIAIMVGAFMGTGAQCSGRFAAATKSPLTGIFASSSCGGPFGMALKTAGFDGLLISGKSDAPVTVTIDARNVGFEDASPIWGQDTVAAQSYFNLKKTDGALVIGPAGENFVRYAVVRSGDRFFGRGGFGAVMGAKNLKAVVARGNEFKILPKNERLFSRVKKTAGRQINANIFTSQLYRRYGTAANFTLCNDGGILPVRNFQRGSDPRVAQVSGETMAEKYNSKPSTCIPCSILCGHKGTVKDGSTHKIPEYETAALLGPNLEIFDTDIVIRWNDLCGDLGLDTISSAVTLGFVMEATEKGLMQSNLKFGSAEGIDAMLDDIAHRRGLGNDLANGTRWLSEKYGGKDFAMHVKGMELAAYDPRGSWGQGLSYAVANRGACHLSSTTFALEVFLGFLSPDSTYAKAHYVKFFEDLYNAINSMYTCLFTSYAYVMEAFVIKFTPKFLLKLVMRTLPAIAILFIDVGVFSRYYEAITGIRMSPTRLKKAGERIHILERYMNTRESISRKDDTLPARLLQEPRSHDEKKWTVPLDKMLNQYYRLRGYDANGIPSPAKMKKLGIDVR